MIIKIDFRYYSIVFLVGSTPLLNIEIYLSAFLAENLFLSLGFEPGMAPSKQRLKARLICHPYSLVFLVWPSACSITLPTLFPKQRLSVRSQFLEANPCFIQPFA